MKVSGKKVHPFAELLPEMTPEEYAGLKASIARIGVKEPVLLIEGAILDGRHRWNAVEDLKKEGVKLKVRTKDGEESEVEIECPTVDFEGSESDAFELVIAKGLAHRHLSSSQKAVVGYRTFMAGKKYAKKGKNKGADISPLIRGMSEEGVDVATLIADAVGTNRTYVFKAKRIAESENGEKIFDRVMKGDVSLQDAYKECVGKSSPSEESTGGEEAESSLVLDGEKNAVGDEYAEIFMEGSKYAEAGALVAKLSKLVQQIEAGPASHWLPSGDVLTWIKSLKKTLSDSAPHIVCPECSGKGVDGDKKPCRLCRKHCYVCKSVLKTAEKVESSQES